MPPTNTPCRSLPDGVTVAIRLQPGAARNGIDGLATLDDGTLVLRVRVGAPPEDGRANAALIRLLAKEWRLPKGAITIRRGARQRLKTVHVAGDPRDLAPRLTAWFAGRDES